MFHLYGLLCSIANCLDFNVTSYKESFFRMQISRSHCCCSSWHRHEQILQLVSVYQLCPFQQVELQYQSNSLSGRVVIQHLYIEFEVVAQRQWLIIAKKT